MQRTIRDKNDPIIESDELLNHPMYKKSCTQCDKFITCYIFRDFAKVIIQNLSSKEDRFPVNPHDIAEICSQYYPKKGTEKGGE